MNFNSSFLVFEVVFNIPKSSVNPNASYINETSKCTETKKKKAGFLENIISTCLIFMPLIGNLVPLSIPLL